MSTDVEPYKPRQELVHRDVVDGWTGVIAEVSKLASMVSDTDFVPKPLRSKPAAITAAILAGREVGIPPMRALQHLHMVDGRPTMSAEQKRAQALAAGHDIVYAETTTTRCVVKGRRHGSDQWTTVTWSIDDAKAAKLDGKDNYRKHPRRMLQARATGELCDLLFPDATGGLATYEQLVDETDAAVAGSDGHAAPAKATARRRTAVKATRGKAAQTEPEPPTASPRPPLPGEDGYDDPTATDSTPNPGAGVSKAQLAKMHAVFNQVDWTDRDDRLLASSAIVGRTLHSSNDLTKQEASALIDTLERVATGPDPAARLGQLVTAAMDSGEVVDGELVDEANEPGTGEKVGD
ncbi:MAG: hypothetical protein ACRDQW_05325 [Haloechinothrix sp.]